MYVMILEVYCIATLYIWDC